MKHTQRGVSMMEALVALLLVGLGLVTYAELQVRTQHALLQHRLRQSALQLARHSLEQTFHDMRVTNIDVTDSQTSVSLDQIEFVVVHTLQAMGGLSARQLLVEVRWQPPDGPTESMRISTILANGDTELMRALFTEPPPSAP